MSPRTLRAATFVSVVVTAVFLVLALGQGARAQQGCLEIRGIAQAILPSPEPIAPDGVNIWGGPAYFSLGGETLIGVFSGNDGGESQHGGRGGHYIVCFPAPNKPQCGDSFTWEVHNSVFGFAPGKAGLGYSKGNSAKIISGTGRFEGASGNLNIAGPYILWPADNLFGVEGRFNGELGGKICVGP